MKINYAVLVTILVAFVSCDSNKKSADQKASQNTAQLATAVRDLGIQARLPYMLSYKVDSLGFPRSLEQDRTVRGVASKDWTSGFYPGSLCYLFSLTGDSAYLHQAEQWLPYLEREKHNDRTHDMGFKVNCSFGNALKLTKKTAYSNILVESATTLATRYNDVVGCIKSWDFGKDLWQFPVIIDNMMNLELLFEATRISGDSSFYQIAVSHATQTMKNHFREDMSSVHVVDYSPETGEVLNKLTHQGFSDESAWARGQAWGLYGYTMVYRYTQDTLFLNQAIAIASFISSHPSIPEDKVPYWDYYEPNIPNVPRDASAAAVTASALVELYEHTSDHQYLTLAQHIMKSLSKSYVLEEEVEAPFLLDHSAGNMPKADEVDVPINYADYYFLEAALRLAQH